MSSSQTYLVFTSSENIFAFAINPTNNCALVGFFFHPWHGFLSVLTVLLVVLIIPHK